MHELGIVYEVIKIVDAFAVENNLTRVDTIILEIGQLSQTIPHFVEACYPAAVSETPYEDTKLEIIVLPGSASLVIKFLMWLTTARFVQTVRVKISV